MPNAKAISLIFVTTVLSFFFWFFSKPWIEGVTKFSQVSLWLIPLIFLIALGSTLALSFMLLPQKRLKVIASALVGITQVLVFGVHYLHLIAVLVIVLFHVFAIRRIQLELQERVKIHMGVMIQRGIAYIVLPLFIALSFAYFLTPTIQQKAETATPDTPTIRQALGKTLDKLLADQKTDTDKNYLKQYAIDKAYDSFGKVLDPYRAYLPPVFAFGLFLTLWGLSFIVYPLILWLGMLLFLLMKQSGFARIEEVDVKAQRIIL